MVPPSRIVSVLGRHDTVTPYRDGARLVAEWGVPDENIFVQDRGHFSVPVGLLRDQRPLKRFVSVMQGIGDRPAR